MQNLRANNPTSQKIQNVEFSLYYYYMNTSIWRDFQNCIKVPLIKRELDCDVLHLKT